MPFARAVEAALRFPLGAALPARLAPGAVTALVADGVTGRDLLALLALSRALARAGAPRGRQFVLLADVPGRAPPDAALRTVLSRRLGLPVLVHEPARSTVFRPGRLRDGTVLEVNDELREAEAIVLCGAHSRAGGGPPAGGPWALVPGLVSDACRRALAARESPATATGGGAWRALAAEVLAVLPVDFALAWSGEPPRVLAGDVERVMLAWQADA